MFLNKKFRYLIGDDQISKFYILILFTIFIAIIETMGIGMVIPVVNIVQDQSYLEKIKDLIPIFNNFSNKQIVIILLVFVSLIYFFKNILVMCYIYWSGQLNQTVRKKLTQKLYYNFLTQKYHFHVKKSSVELVKNINMDADELRFGMYHFFLGVAEFFIFLFIVMFLLFYNFLTTTIIIISFLFILLIYNFFIKKISIKAGTKRFESMTDLQRHVKETFSNIKIIKILSTKKYFGSKFDEYNNEFTKSSLIVDVIVNSPRAVIEITVVIIVMLILFLSFIDNNNTAVFSSIGLYGLAFFRLMPAFNRILTAYSYKNILSHNSNQLYNILNETSDGYSSIEKIKNYKKQNSIKLENINLKDVSFSYDNKKNILENINIEINKNQFFGVIGDSGSGKSTLINLILGLFEPNKGSVTYNQKIEIFKNLEIFEKKISYVPQNISILERSIKENIAFGEKSEDIDINKINKIIKKTKLDGLISKMDNGLDSIINNDNLNISGGELQRIGLARALYFDTDLLVLDESTNSLDVNTEKEILNMIYDNFLGKKIIIFISHKLKNLEKTDFILEIKDKKIEKKLFKNYDTTK